MTDNNQNQENLDNQNQDTTNQNSDTNINKDEDLIQKLVKEKLDESLKDIKSKLDKAYELRDSALKKVADFEQEKKDAELKRLQEEGKFKEAYELQLAEERSRREALEKRNVELTRNIDVRNVLSSYDFRNENALDMAFKEVVDQLVRNEQGVWVHRSGVSLKDFVKSFADREENSFLFKVKANSGSGSSQSKPNASSDKPKSLFALSQEEVLKMAAEGKLPSRG